MLNCSPKNKLIWRTEKPVGTTTCIGKQQSRFYWSFSSVVKKDATPLTPPRVLNNKQSMINFNYVSKLKQGNSPVNIFLEKDKHTSTFCLTLDRQSYSPWKYKKCIALLSVNEERIKTVVCGISNKPGREPFGFVYISLTQWYKHNWSLNLTTASSLT